MKFGKGQSESDKNEAANFRFDTEFDDHERGESWAASPGRRTDGDIGAAVRGRTRNPLTREGRHQRRVQKWAVEKPGKWGDDSKPVPKRKGR